MSVAQDITQSSAAVRRRGPVELIITGFVDKLLVPFVNGILIPFLESGAAFVLFALLWGAFAYALFARQASLDETWHTIRSLPFAVQAVIWLLFLPVMAGLWVWEATWPVVLRFVLVAGLAGWNLLIFLPKWLTASR